MIEPLEKRIAPAFTATLSGSVATLIGDSASDALVIGESGGNLTHNRFMAGDPGYADDLDFNTSVPGSQPFISQDTNIINATGGAGTDDVTITVPTRLTLGSISVNGTVTLTGSGTDIVDGNGTAVNVTAARLVFFAGDSIGMNGTDGAIETQVSNLEVSAGGSVAIINGVTSAVGLTSAIGPVTLHAAMQTASGNIHLRELAGGIEVILAQTPNGDVTLESAGDLNLTTVSASGVVMLEATAGGSINGTLGGSDDISANQLAILGAANVGSSVPLETAVNVFAATNIPGSTTVANDRSLATGTVVGITGMILGTSSAISAAGSFTVSDAISGSGAITLRTLPASTADDLIVTPTGFVTSSGGAISLTSVDGIELSGPVTAGVSSSVAVIGDAIDPDAAGSTITINAPISAAQTHIGTGAEADRIFFPGAVRQTQSPMTIHTGDGIDIVTVQNVVIDAIGDGNRLSIERAENISIVSSTFSGSTGASGVFLPVVGQARLTDVTVTGNQYGVTAVVFSTLTLDRLIGSGNHSGALVLHRGGTVNLIAPSIAAPTDGGGITAVTALNFTPSTGAIDDHVSVTGARFGLVEGYSFFVDNLGALNLNSGDGDDEFNVAGTIGFINTPINLIAGNGDDTVRFLPLGSLVGGIVNGGDGMDTLDYSMFGNPAVVNLSDDAVLQGSLDGMQLVPPTSSTAFGSATMFFDTASGTFDLALDAFGIPLANLSGANIRLGTNGAPIFDLDPCAFSQLANSSVARDLAGATFPAANSAALLAGGSYINLETPDFPNGEIRGQLFLKANARTATGTGTLTRIERAVGSPASDLFVGGDAADIFEGCGADDELIGRGGADLLHGGPGDDKLNGGAVDGAIDSILGGPGSDTYIARRIAGTATLSNDGITSVSAGNDSFSGIEMAIVTGDPAPNILDASDFTLGAVALAGGGGTDTLLATPFAPRISVGDGFANEPATGTVPATFLVTLTAPTFDSVGVTAATSDGTAKVSTNDYATLRTTLFFRPLQTHQNVDVIVQSDAEIEPSESFFLTLTQSSSAALEDPTAVGVIVPPFRVVNATTAVFNDVDGDVVTIRTNKGTFELADFTTVTAGSAGFQLRQINFADDRSEFGGTNLKITAQPDPLLGGDSLVNVGFLNAAGLDLGAVKIAGDLAIIAVGNGNLVTPGLRSLSAHSMGLWGTTTTSDPLTPLISEIYGDLGNFSVTTAMQGVTLAVTGKAGLIAAGSLTNTAILVKGMSNPASSAAALGITSLRIAGDVNNSRILAGHTIAGPTNADVQIGKLSVGGNWIGSDLAAGVDANDGIFGNDNDAIIGSGGSASIVARIAKVTIKGEAFSTLSVNGIVAEKLGSVKIDGATLPLSKTQKDNIPVGQSGTFRVREV